MSMNSSTSPERDTPNLDEEQSASKSTAATLKSPWVLLGIGLIVLLVGAVLQSVGIVSLGVLTIILAIGIIVLSERAISG